MNAFHMRPYLYCNRGIITNCQATFITLEDIYVHFDILDLANVRRIYMYLLYYMSLCDSRVHFHILYVTCRDIQCATYISKSSQSQIVYFGKTT